VQMLQDQIEAMQEAPLVVWGFARFPRRRGRAANLLQHAQQLVRRLRGEPCIRLLWCKVDEGWSPYAVRSRKTACESAL